ncbi:hypothetical protein D0A38_00950 [Xanthomonas campestris pv. incanae]|nr:hypothetical protein D0A38_00950 [Xanthomonas campestris pv. incanae]
MRAMRRYRESFIARERAPTRRLVAVFVDARHARHITPKAPRRCTACMIQRQATLPPRHSARP